MSDVLVVDAGNTSISVGLYRNKKIFRSAFFPRTEAETSRAITASLRKFLRKTMPGSSCISSVTPSTRAAWEKSLHAVTGKAPLWFSHRLDLGIRLRYANKRSIGTDRLANAVAGAFLFGAPVVIADLGTALNVDVVHATQGFIGGVIAPGRGLMLDYMADRAEQLPRLKFSRLNAAVGKSTREAMLLGAGWGMAGMVREILLRLKDAAGPGRVTLCATGGHAESVLKDLDIPVKYVKDLTLLGIGLVHDRNSGS